MCRPTMVHDFQMKTWRTTQIGLERERFLLMVPAADEPLHRQRARPEPDGYARVFEPARGKMQPRLQPGTAHPVRLKDASLAGARCLHPAQNCDSLFSI